MKSKQKNINKGLMAFPLSLLSLAISSSIYAQENSEQEQQNTPAPPIDEVLVVGRLKSSADMLITERLENQTVVDLLGAEQMSRVGDSTLAIALKRVPGVTLVNDQFVYVRGLGERYSSSLLNGARVPSPDLTRNVLPLDIFPTSITESVAVQKGYSSDMPAAFGGGNIDIRTKGIPDGFVASLEIGTGLNSESSDLLTYEGGGNDQWGTDDGTRSLSNKINNALHTYRADINTSTEYSLKPQDIQATVARSGETITLNEAQALNAQLATEVYRDLDIKEESSSLNDQDVGFSLGNAFNLGEQFEFGALASATYDTSTRSKQRIQRVYSSPDEEFKDQTKSSENVRLTASANFGLRFGEDHIIESKNLFLRNTDDDVSVSNEFTQTSPFSSGQGLRQYDYRFESREMEVYQLTGSHTLGSSTRDLIGLGDNFTFISDLKLDWFYSDADAHTDIPSETNIAANITRDVSTGEILASRLVQNSQLMDIRYTELDDTVRSSGLKLSLPISMNQFEIELAGGAKYDRQSRRYPQLDLSLGPRSSASDPTLFGDISDALSDANILNPDYAYEITFQNGLSRSYLAATTTDALWGSMDINWKETWRLALGVRYEDYKHFSAPWQPYRASGSQLRLDLSEVSEDSPPPGTFQENEIYPSASLTYNRPGFLAEDFQLRFAVSKTVVRPDLREVSDSSYLDPLTDIIVNGNSEVVPSDITNFDLRAEWFFSGNNSFTSSLFYKDIQNPIEYFQQAGGEDSITAVIENAESGKSLGIEFEWLSGLDPLGDFASQFFVAGNLTLADSEISTGNSLKTSATNRERPLQGASEYAANIQLGFDSDDGKHTATFVYNVFGERVFTAGVGNEPDAYEQPFNALDFAYTYYPTDTLTVKFKTRNLLDDKVRIRQGDVDVYEETIGQSFSLSLKYSY